jgi:hypothetical protein
MAPSFVTELVSHDWVAVGLPPKVPEGEPLGWLDGLFVVALVALAFYCSVRLVTWVDVKLSSLQLFRELRRELGIGGPRPRRGGRS